MHLTPVDELLDAAAADQAIHNDIFRLADAVAAIDGLVVVRRIPVRVEYDGPVCANEVQTVAADLRRQQAKEEFLTLVELLAQTIARSNLCVAVDADVREGLQVFFLVLDNKFEQVQHLLRHRED